MMVRTDFSLLFIVLILLAAGVVMCILFVRLLMSKRHAAVGVIAAVAACLIAFVVAVGVAVWYQRMAVVERHEAILRRDMAETMARAAEMHERQRKLSLQHDIEIETGTAQQISPEPVPEADHSDDAVAEVNEETLDSTGSGLESESSELEIELPNENDANAPNEPDGNPEKDNSPEAAEADWISTSAAIATAPTNAPEWVDDWRGRDLDSKFSWKGFPAKIVSSDPAPDVMTCAEDLSAKLPEACKGYVASYSPWKIDPTHRLINTAIEDEYVETIDTSVGPQRILHKLLVFDHEFKEHADVEIQHARIANRVGVTGIISGAILTSLAGVFGVISFALRRQERRLSTHESAGN
ncbi:MAG: hypothetical protein KDB27_08935 [Planctomycetales bacterium]|nr:hypothetical protein [Planctomycetales bacterium]